MRPCAVALTLLALALPAAAASAKKEAQRAALDELLQSYPVTVPVARNPLPQDILKRMRAKLVELESGTEEAPETPAPKGH
ncbi:MAG: hypothetical protein ACP5DX_11150 [Paracoccaceae bacterium]